MKTFKTIKPQNQKTMPLEKHKSFVTVSEAAEFLGVSKTAVLFAIKTKKLDAKKDGLQWKIPIKTLEAYNSLRQSVLEKSSRIRGIDQKSVGINVLEREITNAAINNIRITKNFELFRGSSQKPLIEEKTINPLILFLLCNTVQENFTKRFSYENVEIDRQNFLQRMEKLRNFLESIKQEKKKLVAVKAMITTIHPVHTKWIKLEACTGRLLTDQGPLLFSSKISEFAKGIIKDFCCHGDFTLNEVLKIISSLK